MVRKLSLVAVAVLLAVVWWWPEILDHATRTTGQINVSGPQVYTRERLVNDRYREDAWMLRELARSDESTFPIAATSLRTIDRTRELTATANPAAANPSAATPAGAAPAAPTPAADPAAPAPPQPQTVATGPFERLHDLQAYRSQIRTAVIENQLDDRHDLRGNSLYRLKFDAAILPGANTRQNANITVSVLPPKGLIGTRITATTSNDEFRNEIRILENLDSLAQLTDGRQREVWERVYDRWLGSVSRRFEAGRVELRAAFERGTFTDAEYVTVRAKLLDALRVATDGLAATAPTDPVQQDRYGQDFAAAMADARRSRQALDAALREAVAAEPAPVGSATVRIDLRGRQLRDLNLLLAEIDALNARTLSVAVKKASDVPLQSQPGPPATEALAPSGLPASCGTGTAPANSKGYNGTLLSKLDTFVDAAFELSLYKSALGIEANSPAFEELLLITKPVNAGGAASQFGRNTLPLRVTTDRDCAMSAPILPTDAVPARADPRIRPLPFQTPSGPVWVSAQNLQQIQLQLPGYDPAYDVARAAAELARRTARQAPDPNPDPVVDQVVDVGLIKFIRLAGRRLDAFSYAFSPSEADEREMRQLLNDQRRTLGLQAMEAAAGHDLGTTLRDSLVTRFARTDIGVRTPVIGYGTQSNSAIPSFGWLIQPQDTRPDGSRRQRAAQMSLTVLVSLPAWWEEIRVRVGKSWTTNSGETPGRTLPEDEYTIELPVTYETVDGSLFDLLDRSPVVQPIRDTNDHFTVTACESADIVIPGRRLWRSTVVMLGGQKANEIYVLPDMNGIVATFTTVSPQSATQRRGRDSDGTHMEVPLTIWTSLGSQVHPQWVDVANPQKLSRCPDKAEKPSVAAAQTSQ